MKRIVFTEMELNTLYEAIGLWITDRTDDDDKARLAAAASASEKVLTMRTRLRARKK